MSVFRHTQHWNLQEGINENIQNSHTHHSIIFSFFSRIYHHHYYFINILSFFIYFSMLLYNITEYAACLRNKLIKYQTNFKIFHWVPRIILQINSIQMQFHSQRGHIKQKYMYTHISGEFAREWIIVVDSQRFSRISWPSY